MIKWLVMDTETTGLLKPGAVPLKDQPKIIELALIEVAMEGVMINVAPMITREKSWLLNPDQPLDAIITKITGLKDEDLKGQRRFPEILPEVIDWFLGVTGVACHNASFDMGMLINELRRCGKEFAFPYPPQQLCTVVHYTSLFGRRAKLTEVYQRILNKPLPQKHRALDDTRALAEVIIADKVIQ